MKMDMDMDNLPIDALALIYDQLDFVDAEAFSNVSKTTRFITEKINKCQILEKEAELDFLGEKSIIYVSYGCKFSFTTSYVLHGMLEITINGNHFITVNMIDGKFDRVILCNVALFVDLIKDVNKQLLDMTFKEIDDDGMIIFNELTSDDIHYIFDKGNLYFMFSRLWYDEIFKDITDDRFEWSKTIKEDLAETESKQRMELYERMNQIDQ